MYNKQASLDLLDIIISSCKELTLDIKETFRQATGFRIYITDFGEPVLCSQTDYLRKQEKISKKCSIDELKFFLEDSGEYYYAVRDDLDVEFDGENDDFNNDMFPGGFGYIDEIAVCVRQSGEDVEYPVTYFIYLDTQSNLRGYVPKIGNTFNIDKMRAVYDCEEDMNYIRKELKNIGIKGLYGDIRDMFLFIDFNAMKEDFSKNVKLCS